MILFESSFFKRSYLIHSHQVTKSGGEVFPCWKIVYTRQNIVRYIQEYIREKEGMHQGTRTFITSIRRL